MGGGRVPRGGGSANGGGGGGGGTEAILLVVTMVVFIYTYICVKFCLCGIGSTRGRAASTPRAARAARKPLTRGPISFTSLRSRGDRVCT